MTELLFQPFDHSFSKLSLYIILRDAPAFFKTALPCLSRFLIKNYLLAGMLTSFIAQPDFMKRKYSYSKLINRIHYGGANNYISNHANKAQTTENDPQ